MSDVPLDLLSQVPESMQKAVANYWSDWSQSCLSKNINSEIDYPLSRVGTIWACSDFAARVCIRCPDFLHELIAEGLERERLFVDYQAIVRKVLDSRNDVSLDESEMMRNIRLLRQKEMLRITWRDLDDLATQQQVLCEISDLAETITAITLEYLHEDLLSVFGEPIGENGESQQMLVLAMGKMGGRELNFSSDIDLIFCYPSHGETNGKKKIFNHEFFTRLAQKLVKVLNEATQDGFVYRVDTRLRPYGDSGSFVSSFVALEQYYQQQGRDWERYAMIKAKIISGRESDVRYLQSMLRPFVFRRYLDYSAFDSIREMKSMINAEVKRKGIENNIKLGRGGIREIEFIGQTFQLIRGGSEIELQARGIMDVLDSLLDLKLLSKNDVERLKNAYVFHRKLENRLQMERDTQTHLIPDDTQGQEKLTLAMKANSWQQLSEEIQFHRNNVDHVFQSIFLAEDEHATSSNAINAFWFDNNMDNHAEELFSEWLLELGITEPQDIVLSLNTFKKSSRVQVLSEDAVKRLVKLLSAILIALGSRQNFQIIFDRMLEVLLAIVGRQVYINLLLEYPRALDLMTSLCSYSVWFSGQLARYPILLDGLLDNEYFHTISRREDLVVELNHLLHGAEDDLELQMEKLRHFKQAQILKVAALDVHKNVDVTDVAHALSNVAEVICQKVLSIAWSDMVKKHGCPEFVDSGEVKQAAMAIIAYGKFGGDELGYGSDLDLVFLHNSAGEKQMTSGKKCIDNMTFFARVAQKVIHIMETYMHSGRLYEIDTRLRPDGQSGLMVVGVNAFEKYQMEKAWTWEHQALIRARVIAGDDSIQEEFDRIRHLVLQQSRPYEKLLIDVVEMREKMREHLSSRDGATFNIKQDVGGLVDIEFIAQAGVLSSAAENSQLSESTSTLELLEHLASTDWITQSEADGLKQAYRDYRLAINRQALEIVDKSQNEEKLEPHRVHVTQTWSRIMNS